MTRTISTLATVALLIGPLPLIAGCTTSGSQTQQVVAQNNAADRTRITTGPRALSPGR